MRNIPQFAGDLVVVILVVLVFSSLLMLPLGAFAQQTVFNVPSADVMDRGKVYGEVDVSYNGALTPRVVAGIGKRIELGINLNGISVPGVVQTTPTPTVKWKAMENADRGWALLVGDDVFIPAQNHSYRAGNYFYVQVAKTWNTKTRTTAGAYEFTSDVVAPGQRAGGQFAIEQPLGNRVTLAADWYTGGHALGYVTPGIVVRATSKLTWYAAYQIGNSAVSRGNHQLLIEFGWNFN